MPNRLNINNFIMFTAAKFHAALTTSFFIDYVQCILIEGFELFSLLDNILTATSQSPLGRHTNLVSIHHDAQTWYLRPSNYSLPTPYGVCGVHAFLNLVLSVHPPNVG